MTGAAERDLVMSTVREQSEQDDLPLSMWQLVVATFFLFQISIVFIVLFLALPFTALELINEYLLSPDQQIGFADRLGRWVMPASLVLTSLWVLFFTFFAGPPAKQRPWDCLVRCLMGIIGVALNLALFYRFVWLLEWLGVPPEVIEGLQHLANRW